MEIKVIVGVSYRYDPVLTDKCDPPFGCRPGDTVTVVDLPGCPKANTMGKCHVNKDGKFAGMVCTDSLKEVGN